MTFQGVSEVNLPGEVHLLEGLRSEEATLLFEREEDRPAEVAESGIEGEASGVTEETVPPTLLLGGGGDH